MPPPSLSVNPLSTCLHSLTPSSFLSILVHHQHNQILQDQWVSVSSTGKASDCCIRDLGFNPRLHQKLIDVLV